MPVSRYAVTASSKEYGGPRSFLCQIVYNVTGNRKMRTIAIDGFIFKVEIPLRVAGRILNLVSPEVRYLARVKNVFLSLAFPLLRFREDNV
jgi:hypothetical protein